MFHIPDRVPGITPETESNPPRDGKVPVDAVRPKRDRGRKPGDLAETPAEQTPPPASP